MIPVCIQARMNSARLPGKVMRQACGQPLLAYLVERMTAAFPPHEIIVLTSREPSDDPVARWCASTSTRVLRGDLDDVALRFLQAADTLGGPPAVVRLSGDSPLLDAALVTHAKKIFTSQPCDLATNVLTRTFPKGQSVEVISTTALRAAYPHMSAEDREHVTTYFYRNPDAFHIAGFESGGDYGHLRTLVDTQADWETFESLITRMTKPAREHTWRETVQLLQA